MNNDIDREELVASLISTYRKELADLTDQELLSHFNIQRSFGEMTEDDWRYCLSPKG